MYNFVFWDNDKTIKDSSNPHDGSGINIYPNIIGTMKRISENGGSNVIITGGKDPYSESVYFEPQLVLESMTVLLKQLKFIDFVLFPPAPKGVECWGIFPKGDEYVLETFHDKEEYLNLVGEFKKPDTGMLQIAYDILEARGCAISKSNTVYIGDLDTDRQAAEKFGIDFIEASDIHEGKLI